MIVFLNKLFLFIAGLFLFAYSLQTFVDEGLIKSANCKEWNDIFNSKINADLLIQGSSRAWVHISPDKIDSELKVNSYNLGIDGHPFLMQYYRFKLYSEYNSKPKYIIQTLDTLTLSKRKDLYGLEQYLPYLNYKLVREATSYFEGFEYIDFIVPAAKYRHSKDIIYTGINEYYNPSISRKYKGFEAQNKLWDDSFSKYKMSNLVGVVAKVDPLTNILFDDFLKYCKENEIRVILVYTPEYIEAQRLISNRDSIFNIFKEYALKYNIEFLDYSDSHISYDTKYFYNSQHLNSNGVDEFNKLLIADVKSKLKL